MSFYQKKNLQWETKNVEERRKRYITNTLFVIKLQYMQHWPDIPDTHAPPNDFVQNRGNYRETNETNVTPKLTAAGKKISP